MADPFRLTIAKKLTDIIRGVDVVNGYVNNLSTSVFRGRTLFGDTDPLPMVSILEAPIQNENRQPPESSGAKRTSVIEFIIQGWVKDDRINPTDPAYVLSAEVVRALNDAVRADRRNLLGLGGAVIEVRIGNPVVQPPNEISDKPQFILPLGVDFAEDLSVSLV